MLTEFAGRRIIPTTLDPVPRAFRAVPGWIALNHGEIAALEREFKRPRGSPLPTFKHLIGIVQVEDETDMLAAARKPGPRRRRSRVSP